MKLFLLVAISLPIGGFFARAQQSQEEVEKEYAIFNVEKLREQEIIDGAISFNLIVNTGNGIKFSVVKVPAANLKIEIRTDGREATTLKVASILEANGATLLVFNEEDKKAWQDWINKNKEKYEIEGDMGELSLEVNCDNINLIFKTRFRPSWSPFSDPCRQDSRVLQTFYVEKIVTKPENITVKVNEEKAKYKPVVNVLWSEYKLDLKGIVLANKLTIYTLNEKEKSDWEARIKELKTKIEPHRVLPPRD